VWLEPRRKVSGQSDPVLPSYICRAEEILSPQGRTGPIADNSEGDVCTD
jgi:hypothetical protein